MNFYLVKSLKKKHCMCKIIKKAFLRKTKNGHFKMSKMTSCSRKYLNFFTLFTLPLNLVMGYFQLVKNTPYIAFFA